ncbi:DUF4037 domain-containing protein [Priestia taiwanensis]|uniref:DUF4037 domain-containing protein n=1 Tax=Priestia taiwanensis TaxID=1347902 RepID=A0A917ANP2_9BACI|nr:DUF4037 domain-containing protein [Priestia taiwanensis]GGE64095.1 hypothetical protein GCM10007140_12970 [Priestia taiwanensis]
MQLIDKAREMAAIYQQNPKVESVILAGSVSRNLQDEHSDIELHILWSAPPEDKDRNYPINLVDGEILSYHPFEEEEWSEAYITKDDIKLEISNFLTSTVKRFVSDVVKQFETDYDKQCIVASVHDGLSLYGEETIIGLKKEIATYPLQLSKQMISDNLRFGNRWNNREALLNRQDWLMLYDVLCDVQKKVFGVLFGLNKMYVHHPTFKWMAYNIDNMAIKPDNLSERMSAILIDKPENSVNELEILIREVIELVETHLPELNISEQKEAIHYTK